MKTQSVTVFKWNGEGWDITTFPRACVRRIKAINSGDNGRFNKDIMTARIFSPSAVSVSVEDKIAEGSGYKIPPEDALTVFEVADNSFLRRGHVRITAR